MTNAPNSLPCRKAARHRAYMRGHLDPSSRTSDAARQPPKFLTPLLPRMITQRSCYRGTEAVRTKTPASTMTDVATSASLPLAL